jgi:hypothetical protein
LEQVIRDAAKETEDQPASPLTRRLTPSRA